MAIQLMDSERLMLENLLDLLQREREYREAEKISKISGIVINESMEDEELTFTPYAYLKE